MRQVPSSLRWVPGMLLAMGEDGLGDAEGRPTPSGVRCGQEAQGWRGFGQGHRVCGMWGQMVLCLAAARRGTAAYE